jgi:uncharacterized GH25 family protein
MKTIFLWRATALAASLMIVVPMTAQAHRPFLLPSETMTPGANSIVTIDASASDELFNIERPLSLDNVVINGPNGATGTPENPVAGKQRSSFELKLPQEGTYRISLLSDSLSAMYKVNGEMKRWRGTADSFAKEVPANAQGLNVSRMQGRVETFVSAGKSVMQTWKPSGNGLELVPLTKPTEIFVGDTGNFRLLLDGKPAADLTVTVIRGGNRYRDALGEITLKTDRDGKFSIKWPAAGMYWLSAHVGAPRSAVGTFAQPTRRVSYSATLEVLQP